VPVFLSKEEGMSKFKVGDKVSHISDSRCTGTIIAVEHGGAGRYLNTVDWDIVEYESNPSTWYDQDLRLVQDYSTIYSKAIREEQNMSQALWCDKGGHAFSSKDPGKRHFSETRSVDDGYRVSQVTADMDICGPCSEETFLTAPAALTAKTVQDKVPGQ
jgi:hypothetical protein